MSEYKVGDFVTVVSPERPFFEPGDVCLVIETYYPEGLYVKNLTQIREGIEESCLEEGFSTWRPATDSEIQSVGVTVYE